MGGGYFEFNAPEASSSTEQKITNTPEQNKKETRTHIKHPGESCDKIFVQVSHRGPQGIRCRRKDDTLYSSQPYD